MTACFPKAQIIADKFHVGRLVHWVLENVRKEVQKLFHDYRWKYFKKNHWILLKRNQNLTHDGQLQLENMLSVSDELRLAYDIKERFLQLLKIKDADTFIAKFREWEQFVMAANIEAFNRCFNTVSKWYHPIIHACVTGYSNGYVEGCNNKTKVLKRVCFGVRNFERFRNRLLYMANS